MIPAVCSACGPHPTADRMFDDNYGVVGDLLTMLSAAAERIAARRGRAS